MNLRDELSKIWPKDTRMIEHCEKSTKYIEIDGHIVGVCDAKPVIRSEMWYDDETADPGTGKARFIAYNMRNVCDVIEESARKTYFCKAYYRQPDDCLLWDVQTPYAGDHAPEYAIREVTLAEIVLVNNAINEVRADYVKRLDRYYAKYQSKIRSSGYWVNR